MHSKNTQEQKENNDEAFCLLRRDEKKIFFIKF
jgi:hypothetical protein